MYNSFSPLPGAFNVRPVFGPEADSPPRTVRFFFLETHYFYFFLHDAHKHPFGFINSSKYSSP